jgi:ribosome maturation factor RimP
VARHSLIYDEDKMSKSIAKQALEIAAGHAKKMNIEVLDAEYVKEGNERYLRVYLYKPEGISVDDCEFVHKAIDKEIDDLDIRESYYLEVSSPGCDKNLRTEREFEIYMNSEVEVSLYKAMDNQKKFTGTLKDRDSENTTLLINDSLKIFDNKNIAKITRAFKL